VVDLSQPLADVDEGQGVEDPFGKVGVGETVEVAAPVAAFLNQALGAQKGKVLRDASGRQIERGGKAGHVLFALPQLFDQAQAIGMGQELEQIRKLARNDKSTRHAPLHNLQKSAGLQL
jgi:hypothetical protein